MLVSVNVYAVNQPQVMIGGAAQKFDAAGQLTDQPARDLIVQLLIGLRDLAIKLRR
jgi:chromate reductase